MTTSIHELMSGWVPTEEVQATVLSGKDARVFRFVDPTLTGFAHPATLTEKSKDILSRITDKESTELIDMAEKKLRGIKAFDYDALSKPKQHELLSRLFQTTAELVAKREVKRPEGPYTSDEEVASAFRVQLNRIVFKEEGEKISADIRGR